MKATETNGVLMNERAPTKVLGFMVQGGDYTADVLVCPLFEALQNKFVRGGVLRVHKFQLCCLQACGWFFSASGCTGFLPCSSLSCLPKLVFLIVLVRSVDE